MGLPTAFLSRGRPLKGPFYLRLSFLATRKRVHELLKTQLIGNLVLLQLIFNVLLDFLFVFSYRIHEVSPGPEMPIAILVLQICMSVENHKTAFSFEISHDVGNAVLRWKTYQHMDMVRAGLRFNDFNTFLFAQLAQYLTYILFDLTVNYHSPIFRCKHHMVLTSPRGMA